jgi:hypothetical protein
MLLFFIVQSPKQNIFRHQSMTQISEKILWLIFTFDEHCCSNLCSDFSLFDICTAYICLSPPICCCTMNLFSSTTFVSHILQYKMSPSVENQLKVHQLYLCVYIRGKKLKTEGVLLNSNMSYEVRGFD